MELRKENTYKIRPNLCTGMVEKVNQRNNIPFLPDYKTAIFHYIQQQSFTAALFSICEHGPVNFLPGIVFKFLSECWVFLHLNYFFVPLISIYLISWEISHTLYVQCHVPVGQDDDQNRTIYARGTLLVVGFCSHSIQKKKHEQGDKTFLYRIPLTPFKALHRICPLCRWGQASQRSFCIFLGHVVALALWSVQREWPR